MTPGRPSLREFYDTMLAPDLRALDDQRRRIVSRAGYEGLVVVALALGAWAAAAAGVSPVLLFMGAGVAVAAWVVRCYSRSLDYTSAFKRRIVTKLVTFLDPHLKYDPDAFVGQTLFEASGLFSQKPDSYDGGDMVSGKLGATAIVFSEVHAQYRTTSTDGQGHTTTQWHTILKGLFFIADFNKAFQGRTVVLPDVAESLLGRTGQMLQGWNHSRGDLVKLEDPDFERAFVVYSSDQVEARYILTPGLMERILHYKARTDADIRLSFINSQVCVAIPVNRDLFEPRLWRTILDFSLVEDYLGHLDLAAGIVEEFNLNTRIWGKDASP